VLYQHGVILHVFSWCHHHRGSSSCHHDHRITSIIAFPSILVITSIIATATLQTLSSMLKFAAFPEVAMLIVVLGASKDAS
jgi:hypothetical protein